MINMCLQPLFRPHQRKGSWAQRTAQQLRHHFQRGGGAAGGGANGVAASLDHVPMELQVVEMQQTFASPVSPPETAAASPSLQRDLSLPVSTGSSSSSDRSRLSVPVLRGGRVNSTQRRRSASPHHKGNTRSTSLS